MMTFLNQICRIWDLRKLRRFSDSQFVGDACMRRRWARMGSNHPCEGLQERLVLFVWAEC